MPWYKFTASIGPDHHSKMEEYEYYSDDWTKEDLYAVWDDWVRNEDYPVGNKGIKVELITKLPDKVKESKIEEYQYEKEYAEEMLEILNKV